MIQDLEIKHTGNYIVWDENELDILRQNYNGTRKQKELIAQLIKSKYGIDRSLNAIRHRASLEGLTNHNEHKPKWTQEQVDKLLSLVGYYSPEQIALKLNRSLVSVRKKCCRLKVSLNQRNSWYTLSEVKKLFGVGSAKVLVWVNSEKLQAKHYDGHINMWQFSRKNIRKFMRTYPCELEGRNIDTTQVIDILVGLIYKEEC